jgi:hypothetical protein
MSLWDHILDMKIYSLFEDLQDMELCQFYPYEAIVQKNAQIINKIIYC